MILPFFRPILPKGDKMPSHFTLRMQFGPHQDAGTVTRWLLKLVKEAPVDEIMFFFFAEELNDGHDTIERVKKWIEKSRPYRKALADAGIAVSLNPWHSVLHCDRGRSLKPGQNWQTMVGPTGDQCTAVVCPLDENWQRYYDETLRLYAKEGFRVIWVDDDIRYHNHAPLEWGGCFCPLHVAEFNRRARAAATREEIVANCTAPGNVHPWRQIWFDMWEEKHLEMISRWRRIVEEKGCRLGLMSSTMEAHAAEGRRWKNWWKAFGGDKPPVHRPHFWGYNDIEGSWLADFIARLDQNRSIQPQRVESGPEIECFPYGRWNKSFRQIGAQTALAHISGSTNLNISLYDFGGNAPDDEPERADFLRMWRPVCDWLADEFPMGLRSSGVGVPWSENMGRAIRTERGGQWRSLECPSRGWVHWVAPAGYAFSLRPSDMVNALGGPVVWSFSDDELRRWLSQGVLLDGVAADILLQRGMGELIGFKSGRFVTQNDVVYSIEQTIDDSFGLRAGAQMSVNHASYAARLFQGELAEGVKTVSDLRGPTQDVVGHGLVIHENGLGGRVAVVPWDSQKDVEMNIQRAMQLRKTIDYLAGGRCVGRVEGGAWLIGQFLTDGKLWRGVVWNAGPDEIEEFAVYPPAGMGEVKSAVQVNSRGERIDAKLSGNSIRLSRPLYQWEFVVIM